MNISLILFKYTIKPLTKWAARRALVGRNRSRRELEKGRFTRSEVNRFCNQAWRAFDNQAPDVSKEPTPGSRLNVRLAALTLALLRSLLDAGVERDYAIELIGDTCWNIYRYWGRVGGHFLSRLSSHDPIKDHTKRVGKDSSLPMPFPFNPPGYRARYVPIKDGIGFNIIHCPVAEYFHAHCAEDLAVGTWCMLDYPLAEMLDLKLVRTRTLAAGDDKCDFRWLAATNPDMKVRPA
jgi:ubiquinone biosynthesis protein